MKRDYFYKIVATVLSVVFMYISIIPVRMALAEITCIKLSYDLYSGLKDSGSDGSVSTFQNYLKSLGYLSAEPSGYFGPATVAAVKIYQGKNDISATGYVGPQTRRLIGQKTCTLGTLGTAIAPSSMTNYVTQPISVQVPVSIVSNGSISSPATGQVISIGSSIVIRWDRSVSVNYDISLEQPGGAGAGFIVSDQSPTTNSNQYIWKVGRVASSQTNSYQYVPVGTYRMRLHSSSAGTLSGDQVSGWFTITASRFSIAQVVPSSALADDGTSVVLLGSGFTPSSSVYFDANYSNLQARNTYISPDGTVLVFTVPTTVPQGPHTLYINDGQGSSPVSMSFVVSSIQ